MKKAIKKIEKENEESFSFFTLKEDKRYFLENLSMLIGASIPINKSLLIIEKGVRSRRMKRAIKAMVEKLEGGKNLSEVINESGIFESYVVSLIKVGEKTGKLTDNLKVIIGQKRKNESFKAKIVSAMLYPFIILFISLMIAGGVSLFLLPKLAKVFSDLNMRLPPITEAMISFSYFIEDYGLIFIPALLFVISLFAYFFFFKKETKFIGQYLAFNVFGAKKVIQESELARLGYNMGILLKSGLPISECFNSLIDSTDFYCYCNLYKKLKISIEEGETFSQFFEKNNADDFFPRPIQQMIIVSENSGTLADTMFNIGQIYQEKIDNTTKNISSIIEPILLIIVWVGVLSLSLAIILPIYNFIGNFNAGF
ncbi:MAG: type II secretion system F family protein [Candidatus Paceibacterota bacterium]